MIYAYRTADDAATGDLSRRIQAVEHRGELAICPLHGCQVKSKPINGIWQWVHVRLPNRFSCRGER